METLFVVGVARIGPAYFHPSSSSSSSSSHPCRNKSKIRPRRIASVRSPAISSMSSYSEEDPIEAYFAKFPSFSYRPSTDWRQLAPFNSLANHLGWSKTHRKNEFNHFKETWTQVVESEFSGSSISHYQSLCKDLDIEPIPDSVAGCKTVLREVFNIVDLVQYRKDCQQGKIASKPQKFRSLKQLSQYTSNENKYYSKHNAKAEMLRELLKKVS
jgi:hypothetical protein